MEPGGEIDRRLGSRDAVEIPVLWHLAPATGRRRWLALTGRGEHEVEHAVIVNLSVSGAAVLARSAPELVLGSPVVMEVEGCRGTVIICRTQPAGEPGHAVYGVAFVDMTPELRDRLWRLLGVVAGS